MSLRAFAAARGAEEYQTHSGTVLLERVGENKPLSPCLNSPLLSGTSPPLARGSLAARLGRARGRSARPRRAAKRDALVFRESRVVPHHQMTVDLLYQVER